MRWRKMFVCTFLPVSLLACGHETGLPPTQADHIPELTLMGSALRDHFAFAGHWWQSTVLDAPAGATRVGVFLELEPEAGLPVLEARGIDAAGQVGDWQRVEVTWSEGVLHVGRADLGMDAFAAELRASSIGSLRSLTWSAVVPVVQDSNVASVEHALRPELADIVVDRPSWGARPTGCSTRNAAKTRMAIHHTVTPATGDTPARMRGIQAYHMDSNGWCDIGYHFLVGLDGTVYEGRDLDLLGAHVGGHNTGNVGVSLIGCFHTSGCMDWAPFEAPEVMVDAAATMVGRITNLYDINIDATTVKGHRDHEGASTSCPGDNLHARLDDIRSRAGGVTPGVLYRASWASQSFPLASETFLLDPGAEQLGHIEMRNDGSATWMPGETFLATTEPRDAASALAGGDWVSPSRAASVDRAVAPGETGRFEFSVRAPLVAGDYPQFFNLTQAGVWFSDPGQGGPPDDQLQVRVTVSVNGDAGTPDPDAAVPVDGGPADVGPDARRDTGDVSSGCGCRTQGGNAPWFFSMLALFALRLRHRR